MLHNSKTTALCDLATLRRRSATEGDEGGPPGAEDHLGTYIKKVQFKLHPSFANPTRGVSPPWEIVVPLPR